MRLATFLATRRLRRPARRRGPRRPRSSRSAPAPSSTGSRRGDRTPADGEAFALAEVTLLAPVPRPRAIFGIGLNYAAHARETGKELPEAPIVFMKLPTSSVPPSGPVRCPAVVKRLDYEVELAVVMGAGGEIAGYAVGRRRLARATCRSASRSGRAPRASTRSAPGGRGSRPPTRCPTRRTCA